MPKTNVIVIGGGAAGFFAAINTAQLHPGCSVTLLEKTGKLLAKVKVSGGGRCNVTHACFDNALLVKNYPRGEKELRNVFSRFTTSDTVKWFEDRGVLLKTENDGRMFPVSDNSETIINCLLKEAERSGVKIKTGVDIDTIERNADGGFTLRVKGGGTFAANKLIIATGGNSKEAAYGWLKALGHTVVPPVPSLFTFNMPGDPVTKLMGISVPHAKVRIAGTKLETEGPLLITHWGMSGPAILKASAWCARQLNELNYNFTAHVSWLAGYSEENLRNGIETQRKENGAKSVLHTCPFELPKRLWEYLVYRAGITSLARWADLNKNQFNILLSVLIRDAYRVQGKTTFKEEFVTCGGISTKEIDFSTLQSKLVPGLFFAGEVIDVDGVTGGFNFQNAWSTGWVAAKNIL